MFILVHRIFKKFNVAYSCSTASTIISLIEHKQFSDVVALRFSCAI